MFGNGSALHVIISVIAGSALSRSEALRAAGVEDMSRVRLVAPKPRGKIPVLKDGR